MYTCKNQKAKQFGVLVPVGGAVGLLKVLKRTGIRSHEDKVNGKRPQAFHLLEHKTLGQPSFLFQGGLFLLGGNCCKTGHCLLWVTHSFGMSD